LLRSARGFLAVLIAATGFAAAAPAADAQPFECPQLIDRYPMDGWPYPDHAESKGFCPYIGYAIDYGDAEEIVGNQTAADFARRAAANGYSAEERSYTDWTGTDWKSVSGGVHSVNILYYVPWWADENGIGYTCRYAATVSGTTGVGNWTYQLQSVTCSTYT
jgi:hypothetical protein